MHLPVELHLEIIKYLDFSDAWNYCNFLNLPKSVAIQYYNFIDLKNCEYWFDFLDSYMFSQEDCMALNSNKKFRDNAHVITKLALSYHHKVRQSDGDFFEDSDEWEDLDDSDEWEDVSDDSDEWEDDNASDGSGEWDPWNELVYMLVQTIV